MSSSTTTTTGGPTNSAAYNMYYNGWSNEYGCDGCGKDITYVDRYHCPECTDFDYCSSCYLSKGKKCPKSHRMILERLDRIQIKKEILEKGYDGCGAMVWRALSEMFCERPFLGYKKKRGVGGPTYEYETYEEVACKVAAICHSIVKTIFGPESGDQYNLNIKRPVGKGDQQRLCYPMFSIYMKNSKEWIYADLASTIMGTTTSGIDHEGNTDVVSHILGVTESVLCFTEARLLPNLADAIILNQQNGLDRTRAIIVSAPNGGSTEYDAAVAEFSKRFKSRPSLGRVPRVYSLDQIIAEGMGKLFGSCVTPGDKDKKLKDCLKAPKRNLDEIFTLLFTSGSTGRPKGAITTHGVWANGTFQIGTRADPMVNVIYRPLSYATDRELFWRVVANGGRVAIFQGEVGDLFDDLRIISPSSFSGPPRLWNMLYDRFLSDFKTEFRKKKEEAIAERAKAGKPPLSQVNMETLDVVLNRETRTSVLERYKSTVGKRVTSIGFGSAPTRPEVQKFLKDCFECGKVYESYGTTEAGGITFDNQIASDVKVKLLDIPEMGYLNSNKPYPQGEICVITRDLTEGYWGDEEQTAKLFHTDEKGVKWLRTGDVGEIGPGPRDLRILERCSNVIKLASGTFMSPQSVEASLQEAEGIKELFVHAEPGWEFPVAIVTFQDKFLAEDHKNHIPQARVAVMGKMQELARQKNIPPLHVPHGLFVSPVHFTRENKLLTISMKLARAEIKKRFKDDLEDLYTALMLPTSTSNGGGMGEPTSTVNTFDKLNSADWYVDDDSGLNSIVCNTLLKLFKSTLRVQECSVSHTAQSLGADSIACALLKRKITEKFNLESTLSYQTVFTSAISRLAMMVEEDLRRQHEGSSDSHQTNSHQKEDENQEGEAILSWLDQYVPVSSDLLLLKPTTTTAQAPPSPACSGEVVLLTGVTGFIGGHVLHSLLNYHSTDTTGYYEKVFCLVRAKDYAGAVARVKTTFPFPSHHPATRQLIDAFTTGRLQVVLGDLAQSVPSALSREESEEELAQSPPLGLSQTVIAELQSCVTQVIHCGAIVNHVLPFSEMCTSNIGSTYELLKLFCQPHSSPLLLHQSAGEKRKRLKFWLVSTTSACALTHRSDEEAAVDWVADSSRKFIRDHIKTGKNDRELGQMFAASRSNKESFPVLYLNSGNKGSVSSFGRKTSAETLANSHLSGYQTTKWAAERCVNQYHQLLLEEEGRQQVQGEDSTSTLDISLGIVRCGMTSWSTNTGVGNTSDWFVALANGISKLGSYPESKPKDPYHLNLAPVDWVADCVVKLAASIPSCDGKAALPPVLSLSNPCSVLSLRTLCQDVLGAQPVPLPEWKTTMASAAHSGPNHAAQGLGKRSNSNFVLGADSESDDVEKNLGGDDVPPALRRLNDLSFMFERGLPSGDRPTAPRDGDRTSSSLLLGDDLWFGDERLHLNISQAPGGERKSSATLFAGWLAGLE